MPDRPEGDPDVIAPDREWAGEDYLDRFVDRAVLSRRRGTRPPSRWRRRDGQSRSS